MSKDKKMSSNAKTILTVIVFVCVLGVFFLLEALNNRTYYSDSENTCATVANIYNGGAFATDGERIFFSNHRDDGTLYSMSLKLDDYEKLYNDKVRYINADENYVYYARINNMKEESEKGLFIFRNTGIYRITKNGKNLKMLYGEPGGQLQVYRNKVYYQKYNTKTGLNLYSVGIDGSDDTMVTNDFIPAAAIHGDFIYYVDSSDANIYRMSLNNQAVSKAVSKKAYMPVPTDSGIYYISTSDGYSICKCGFDGTNEQLLVAGMCSTFNLSSDERYIYYQKDNSDNNGIHSFDTVTGIDIEIMPGNYKWINVIGDHVFFYDYDETGVYEYTPATGVNTFNPEVEE